MREVFRMQRAQSPVIPVILESGAVEAAELSGLPRASLRDQRNTNPLVITNEVR
jgi:hypothetical protein